MIWEVREDEPTLVEELRVEAIELGSTQATKAEPPPLLSGARCGHNLDASSCERGKRTPGITFPQGALRKP
jgi:hypothetical protein